MNNYLDDNIILSFNFFNQNDFTEIFNYCNRFFSDSIDLNNYSKELIQKHLNKLVKYEVLLNNYQLSKNGKHMLNQLNIHSIRIIIKSYRNHKLKKYKKQYSLKEIRPEQNKLRQYLIKNSPQQCSFCLKNLPLQLLEAAHIKPRCLIPGSFDKNDNHNLMWLCRYCHPLFDEGLFSVNDDKLVKSSELNVDNYDFEIPNNKIILSEKQKEYMNFHYCNIFKI